MSSNITKVVLFLKLLFGVKQVWSLEPETYNPYLDIYPAEDNVTGTPLYFALMLSFPESQFDSYGGVAGVRVALDRINSDPYLLQNYTLRYTLTNSSCNRTVALDAFFNQIISGPTKLAFMGSGCSIATEPTAEVSHYYNITHISCVSSSTELRNRVRFPRYFQLLPTEETISLAYFAIIKEYKWRHVALIVQNENLFTVTVELLKTLLNQENISYSENLFDTEDGITGLGENIFDPEARIHIIVTYVVHAKPLLCEAYFNDIVYPRHLLLLPAWYEPRWWVDQDQNITCSLEEREIVLNKSLAFLHIEFLQDLNLTTTTGITGAEYLEEESHHLHTLPLNLTHSDYAQYCYDSTWTLAYALNKTINEINNNMTLNEELAEAYFETGDSYIPFGLENFTYTSNKLLDIIFKHAERTHFDGLTGPVIFEDQGIRAPNRLTVFQFRPVQTENGTEQRMFEIGHILPVNSTDEFNYAPNETRLTVWPGNLVPYDGRPIEEVATVSVVLTAVFSVLATFGITLTIVCLLFNITFRNKKLIRLTSPNLNHLIIVGAIVLYIDVYCTVIPSTKHDTVTIFCNLAPWLTAIGYSLCYGTIVVKMCRVYYIFNNPTAEKKSSMVKDWILALGVLLLVVIDVLILITYTAVEGARGNLSAQRVPNRENPEDITGEQDVVTKYFTYICDSRAHRITIGLLYGYKALIQIVAIVFAFSTRKVKVKGLDDSKYIAAAVYVTSIVTAVIIVAYYSLKDFVNGYAAVISAGLFVGTTFILVLVFVPVMISLYKDPEGDKIFVKSNKSIKSSTTSNNETHVQTIDSLRKRNEELEDTITKLKRIIETKSNGEFILDPKSDEEDSTDLPRMTQFASPTGAHDESCK